MQEENPFQNHKQIFKDVKREERPAFLRKILDTPQINEKVPDFSRPFPDSGKWNHMGNELHYQYAKN